MLLLQQLYEPLFISRSCPTDDMDTVNTLECLLVGKGCEVSACDQCLFRCLIIPDTDLATDLLGCSRMISGNHLHLDACMLTLTDGIGHINSYRITDTTDSLQMEMRKTVG